MFYGNTLSAIPVDRTRFAGFGTVGDTYPCSTSEVELFFDDKVCFPKETKNTGKPSIRFESTRPHTLG